MRRALATIKVALTVTKVALIVVGVVLVVARVLEQCLGDYRTKCGHSRAGCTA